VDQLNSNLHVGTSSFTATGWEGSFYPAGMKAADFLTYYATKFDTVEVDSTFYRTRSVATVNGWERKTPARFKLAAKVPQVITHEKILRDCDDELKQFLDTMDLMGPSSGHFCFNSDISIIRSSKAGRNFLCDYTYSSRNCRKGIVSRWRFATNIGSPLSSSICCASTKSRTR
jgi:hypothetical protein